MGPRRRDSDPVAVCLGRTAEETYQAVLARTVDWVSVDKGWQFRLDVGKWQTVDLPHDWSIAFMPALDNGTDQYNAFLPGGVGECRKDITVGESMTLLFEGAFRDVKLFVNGKLEATNFYGYLPFSAPLRWTSSSPATSSALAAADMKDLVPMPSRCCRTWHGRALGVVRKNSLFDFRLQFTDF